MDSTLNDEGPLDATYWLSTAYALCAGDAYRKSLAMFFTPPSLTSRLLDDLTASGVRFDEGSFCDPACGGAAFLAPIALRMKEELRAKGMPARRVLEHISKNLFGADIDATLCKLSKHFLLMALRDEVVASNGWVPKLHIDVGDSLSALQPVYGTFDVIVCNSPFRKMSAHEVAPYRHLFGDVIEAQPNLYGLFMALSVKLLKDTGVAALVTPTSYLSGQYFRKVRTFLLKHVDVLNIGMVIRADGSLAFDANAKGSDEHRFVDLGTTSHACVVRKPSVLLQRVTSNDQPRRLVAAAVPATLLAEFGGYVGENHTVILEQVDDVPALTPAQMAQLLATPTVDRYFRCISGATNVSAFEMGQLALPQPTKLNELLARGLSMEEAARAAFFKDA